MMQQQRNLLSQQPITWQGDLSDDCTAEWAGLMLRAEWMDKNYWWWAVYDMQKEGTTIDSSNEYPETPLGGEAAREKAENTARNYIANILRPITAKYLIIDTFKIPGRGIVFAGYITEGSVLIGDIIEFSAFHTLRHRPVTGIEGIAHSQANKINTGLLIKCNSEEEIEELRNWNPEKTRAIIYKR